jgi:hypothetical protein
MNTHKLILVILFALSVDLLFAQPTSVDPNKPKDPGFFGGKKDGGPDDPNGRILQGVITNDTGEAIEGAVVTIKNLKTEKMRSFITQKTGSYRFDSLSMDVDYDLIASYKGAKSELRKLSRFDGRKIAIRNITIPPKDALKDSAKESK